ncbi:MAG: STAS domain-containing protein [Gammaproteobacteria bacterium]
MRETTTVQVCANSHIAIKGELNFMTVRHVLKHLEQSILRLKAVGQIDLQAVTQVDSAGLALLIHLLRFAKYQHKTINFENIPQRLHAISTISGVDRLLFTNEERA